MFEKAGVVYLSFAQHALSIAGLFLGRRNTLLGYAKFGLHSARRRAGGGDESADLLRHLARPTLSRHRQR